MKDEHQVVSTIIPTYNRSGQLKKAVRSVLEQGYPHIKVCIFDNASEDDTESVVREFQKSDSRIMYHRHPYNIGAFNNFVFGLKQVDTPFFSILSDDDFLLPDFFENAIREFSRHPDCGFAALGCLVSDGTKTIRKPVINNNMAGYYTPPHGFDVMLKDWMTLTWTSIVFKKEVVDRAGSLLDSPCLPNDIEYLMRIGAQYPIVISEKPGAVFTDTLSGHSSVTELRWIWPCYLGVIEHILSYPSLSETQKKEARRVLLGRLKKRLIYSSLSYIGRQDNKMAEEARIPLKTFFHARAVSSLLKIIILLNTILPWVIRPWVNLLIRKKHTIIYLFENIQYFFKNSFVQSLKQR
jgi:glycosyltransferase involved in cell wall biosynthesis